MRTLELKRNIIQDVNALANDEIALSRISRYVRRLRTMNSASNPVHEEITPYTMEEINQWLDESEADDQAGRTYTCDEVHSHIENKYPWLYK